MTQRPTRWYDAQPEMAEAITILLALPLTYQDAIASELNSPFENRVEENRRRSNLRSMGAINIQALYKSKRKLREYDKIPSMHVLMNTLMVFDEDERPIVGALMRSITIDVQEYLTLCTRLGRKDSLQEVRNFVHAQLEGNIDASARVLTILRKTAEKLEKPSTLVITSALPAKNALEKVVAAEIPVPISMEDTTTAIGDTDEGMRIFKNDEDDAD